MDPFHCKICGTPRVVEARFCRRCGTAFFPRVDEEDLPAGDGEDEEDELGFAALRHSQTLEEVIKDAVPENYKELTIEQVRRHIVRFLWKHFQGIDPYPSTQELIEREQEHERQMQGFIERNEPPPLNLFATWGMLDESVKKFEKPYHLVWVNGLVRHMDLLPQEVEDVRQQIEKFYYKIEPCDCDKVRYVPSETNPNFLRRV